MWFHFPSTLKAIPRFLKPVVLIVRQEINPFIADIMAITISHFPLGGFCRSYEISHDESHCPEVMIFQY